MRTIIITKNEAGQRLDKFLLKYLNHAPVSLIYKYLRKKDIRLNGARAQGNEKLEEGDKILIRLPDQITESLMAPKASFTAYPHIEVLYEDENVLILNKPAGILSQKASSADISLNEEMISYLMAQGTADAESLALFKPSVCNRLDRNTAGIVLAAKTLPAAQALNACIRSRGMKKYYQCLTKGTLETQMRPEGWLIKDEKKNRVRILNRPEEGASRIITGIRPLRTSGGFSRLEVDLITGKTHQIRAQLSALGYPIIGDAKYGGRMQGVHGQMLVAQRVVFPETDGVLSGLSRRTIAAPLPSAFLKTAGELKLDI